ncbi:MAG: 3-ketoacyl-ACP reductase [Chloroflexi bacterium]|nr:3-ketoacyl-ACP reductase [Chloroflexota bacterium]|tara:strand:+ start:33717 stop:34547 length:831 start_codon:yes stop_codon:yes gene_type:complete
MDFSGKVTVVTGGALGIGGGIARKFAEKGSKIVIADIDMVHANKNSETIINMGGECETILTDISKSEDIKRMVEFSLEKYGRIDNLIQNAFSTGNSTEFSGSAMEVSEEGWDKGISMLQKALFLGAKFAGKELIKNKGNIINISSVHGLLMSKGAIVYEAGKSAVIGMTKQMACDFGPLGVRVNAICPGHIVTEKMKIRWEEMPKGLKFFEEQYPVRRTGVPEDIANGVAFLCSDEASFITGHSLVIDGGLSIQLQEDFGVDQAKYAKSNDIEFPY